jgi:hypothetical protein
VFSLFLEAAGQVALVAVFLGAGLPVLFALGVRSFAVARIAGGASAADGTGTDHGLRQPLLRAGGILCFVLVVAAVAVGLTVIIATGFGQEVSFENIVPSFVPKD